MTNLEIIKYLAYENPSRLAELLNDIRCDGRLRHHISAMGRNPSNEFDDFEQWLNSDAKKSSVWYKDELKEWNKAINHVYLIDFGESKIECKDGKLSIQSGDCNIVIDQAIGEIKLLENVLETDKHSSSVYGSFRKEVCSECPSTECIQSKMDIIECPIFDNYLKKENKL